MRALVKYASGAGNVALREVERPACGSEQILIKIAAVAICGTDRAAVEGGHDYLIPRTLGHEASGVIAEIGAAANRPDLAVGDRVTVETDAYLCMTCVYCKQEEFHRCRNRRGIGTTADGALADYLVIPARAVHRLPDNVPLLAGALTEPVAISVHAVIERSPSLAGEVVVVVGPGAVGQLCAQVARAAGATVVLAGRSRHAGQLARAREAGIHYTVDTETQDLAEFVRGITGGYGAHSVYECSGGPGVLEGIGPVLRKGGRIVLVAFYRTPPQVDVDYLIQNELELVGSRGKKPSSFRTALRLMGEGFIDVESAIGAALPLDEWEQGLALVSQGVKVVLRVDDTLDG
ncbi:alcohol dehydrogenase catalytic domain-containing protein [Propionicicella superfundia]|uniref:alcohol dehydrogenase catalytic domain-containing protein n=1 Tax=Propionicicella superfundia TaxID=348582 RepID=UPI0004216A4C|nr:alcohol dehydrogenase catalytic domain-containing protein [Propionicicella superfundia]